MDTSTESVGFKVDSLRKVKMRLSSGMEPYGQPPSSSTSHPQPSHLYGGRRTKAVAEVLSTPVARGECSGSALSTVAAFNVAHRGVSLEETEHRKAHLVKALAAEAAGCAWPILQAHGTVASTADFHLHTPLHLTFLNGNKLFHLARSN